MCTLALYLKSFDHYPLVVAANRDEYYDRPSAAPALLRVRPAIVAGRDLRAGGTWLGINEHGLAAGILNRRTDGEQEPRPEARSRGLLCLDILGLKTAADARRYIEGHSDHYQPFTLVCADLNDAWSGHNRGGRLETTPLDPGLHVFSSTTESNPSSDKRDRASVRFADFAENLRSDGTLAADGFLRLREVLGDHSLGDSSNDPRDAICVHREDAGTVSSSIIVYSSRERRLRTFFCSGAPCRNLFNQPLDLDLQ